MKIKSVGTKGDWSPLFNRLDGWEEIEKRYTNGEHVFYESTILNFDLETNDPKHFSFLQKLKIGSLDKSDTITIQSPEGVKVKVSLVEEVSKKRTTSPYLLNHTAVSVQSIEKEAPWWKEVLQSKEVLSVNAGWDPLIKGPLNAMHIYKEQDFYLTLREQRDSGFVHHLGFEVAGMESIKDVESVLKEIGWEIFWEGTIDSSYVLHFVGADGLIHDFFHTSPELKRGAVFR